jgi:hypothetical protein
VLTSPRRGRADKLPERQRAEMREALQSPGYPLGPYAPRRHQTWTTCSLDVWLRYKSKAVDLAGLNRTCKVKVKRRDGSLRAKGGRPCKRHSQGISSAARHLQLRRDGEE